MPINPLALQVQIPEIQSPMNSMAKGITLQNAMLKQQQMRDEMEQAKRDRALDGAIQQHLASGGSVDDLPKLFGTKGIAVAKLLLDNQNTQATGAKTRSDVLDQELVRSRRLLDTVRDGAGYLAWHEANHRNPLIGPWLASMGIDTASTRAQIETELAQPGGLERLLAKSAMGLDKFLEKNAPSYNEIDLGNVKVTEQRPGLGMEPPKVVGAYEVGISPYQEQDLAIRRGQEERLRAEQDRETAKDQETGVVAREVTDEAGNVRFFDKFGAEVTPKDATGAPAPVKGKPTAEYAKRKALREQTQRDLDRAIAEVSEASKDGGLIDQSTGSGAGRALDALGNFVGVATDGSVAIGKLRPIADLVLKMVPRFEGPQSDKDTLSYQQAAGQLADPTLPNKTRKQAAITIVRLMKERRNQFVSKEEADAGGKPSTGTSAPAGVDQGDWDMMTPEEQALWQQ